MKRIKTFEGFLLEGWGDVFLGAWRQATSPQVQQVSSDKPTVTATAQKTTSASAGAGGIANALGSGSNDFLLYMPHQQGVAGAKGLLQALVGSGPMHPETLKTKACGSKSSVPYANLQCNFPSDKPSEKTEMVSALNQGDQSKAAAIFLKTWKQKWVDKQREAKIEIEKPERAEVKRAIEKWAGKLGVPFDFAVTMAFIESGLNPKAGNAKYKGLYALPQNEFSKILPKGDIYKAEDNARAGLTFMKKNTGTFTKALGPAVAVLNVGSWAKTLA